MEPFFFYLFAGITIAGSLGVIVNRNPIASALALVATLFASAALFALLQAHFLAVIQVLVYVGAIMVLFLFVIMLMEIKIDKWQFTRNQISWGVTVLLLSALLCGRFIYSYLTTPDGQANTLSNEFGTIQEVGRLMFGPYLFAFETVALLLLVALIGTVLMTTRSRSDKHD